MCLPLLSTLSREVANDFLRITRSCIPALLQSCLSEEMACSLTSNLCLASLTPALPRVYVPCSPRRHAHHSETPRLCLRRPCTPRSALPRLLPRSPSAIGPTGRERSSAKGLQTHKGIMSFRVVAASPASDSSSHGTDEGFPALSSLPLALHWAVTL